MGTVFSLAFFALALGVVAVSLRFLRTLFPVFFLVGEDLALVRDAN